jgi:metallo-beta-lactamase class B
MKPQILGVLLVASFGFGQSRPDTIDGHVAAAKAAAGTEHLAIFETTCTAPAPAAPATAPRGSRGSGPLPASAWHAEPVKVFDNLYFVGQTEYSAWAVSTSDGIIIIDAIFDCRSRMKSSTD